MPYVFYKVIHLLGVLMIVLSLGAVLQHAISGGTRATNPWRKIIGITHGVGLVLVLVAGFGLLARLGLSWPFPGWVIAKLLIWLILGGLTALAARSPASSKGLWWVVLILGGVAAWLAGSKPF
jgi:hypothetical protein